MKNVSRHRKAIPIMDAAPVVNPHPVGMRKLFLAMFHPHIISWHPCPLYQTRVLIPSTQTGV